MCIRDSSQTPEVWTLPDIYTANVSTRSRIYRFYHHYHLIRLFPSVGLSCLDDKELPERQRSLSWARTFGTPFVMGSAYADSRRPIFGDVRGRFDHRERCRGCAPASQLDHAYSQLLDGRQDGMLTRWRTPTMVQFLVANWCRLHFIRRSSV